MNKTVAFKLFAVCISVLLITSAVFFHYTEYDVFAIIRAEKAVSDYEKDNSHEALTRIICYSLITHDFEKMNKYGYQFFFPESERDKDVLMTVFNDFWYEANDSFTEENIKTMYNVSLWLYVFSFIVDCDTLEVKNYAEIEAEISEVYLKCFEVLVAADDTGAEAKTVIYLYVDTEDFPKDFLGILNLYSLNKSEEETKLIHRIAFTLARDFEMYPESHFWSGVMSNSARSYMILKERNDVKNTTGNGILEADYSIEELEKIMDSFKESNDNGYNEISNYFSVLPKEYANGFYYSFHYYTKDYILSFYGSPVHCMSVSEADTGRMLYGKTKVVSDDLGLQWCEIENWDYYIEHEFD